MGKRKSQTNQSQAAKRNCRNNNRIEDSDSETEGFEQNDVEEIPRSSQISLSQQYIFTRRSGKVLSVKLRNFMCHRNLAVDFNQHTNLLIGQNGSGKSAILTALIIGLGSKANATNRSSNIKQLIRTGEASATIEVHLSNNGGDSYEYDKYGDRIVVVRQISQSGSSSYKLKNANGNVISTSRADLLKLILYMNIQVDNPICVMTQDASRSFLRDSNPKKRYELFLKATQLDIIIEKLDECTHAIEKGKAYYRSHQIACQALQEKKTEIDKKVSQFQSMEPLKEEIKQYKMQSAWKKVIDQEGLMEEINSTFDVTNQQKTLHEDQLRKYVDSAKFNAEYSGLNEEANGLTVSMNEEQKKLEDEKAIWKRKNDNLLTNQRNIKTIETQKNKTQETITKLEGCIREELESDKGRVEEIKKQNEQKLQDLRAKQTDLEATIKSHTHEENVFRSANVNYRNQIEGMKARRSKLIDEKNRVETLLKNIHGSAQSKLQQYGGHMPNLLNDLQRLHKSGKLKQLPVGPIANHIEIVEPKYRRFVEDALTNYLYGFCVDNAEDTVVVRQLIQSKYPQANHYPIITSKFFDHVYDTANKSVQSDDHTVRLIDIIEADTPVVMNCLIDHLGIDTILFTDNFEHAKKITSVKPNVPKNLTRVIATDPYTEFFPAPTYRAYSKKSKSTQLLRVNEADRERTFNSELKVILESIAKLSQEYTGIQEKIRENNQRIDERSQSLVKAEQTLQLRKNEIAEIESYEYEHGIDISVMRSEVAEQTKILERQSARHEEAKKQYDQLKLELGKSERLIGELKKRIQNFEKQIQEKHNAKDSIEEQMSKRESMIDHYQIKVDTIQSALDKISKERRDAKEKLDRLEATAIKIGPRVDTTHTEEQLQAMIRKNEKKINNVFTSTETLEELIQQSDALDEDLQGKKIISDTLKKSLQLLYTSVRRRFEHVSALKNFMKTRIAHHFVSIMGLRKCDASLNFEDAEGKLDIEVIPRDKKGSNTVSKTTNLSGGERSYVTVAFLISLWACVDHPFYFLDEYDVFTDLVNRSFMTKLLLAEAKKNPIYQYTFLTPQDISDITPTPELSILRLENPDR